MNMKRLYHNTSKMKWASEIRVDEKAEKQNNEDEEKNEKEGEDEEKLYAKQEPRGPLAELYKYVFGHMYDLSEKKPLFT